MKIKVDLGGFIAFLALFCLVCVSIALPSTIKASPIPYNPWADLNNDGVINILDVVGVTGIYGATGTPITKAAVAYDSGWLNITDKRGQLFTITHNLNIPDWNNQSIMVDITGKKTPTSPIQRLGIGAPGINRTYGGTKTDVANAVVQTSEGGYALAGYTSSLGAGIQDMWLVKTDSAGNHLWNRTYGGANYDGAYSIVQTNDGGYALGGYTGSFGAGYDDVWLVKTDGAGNMLWNRTYGGANFDDAYSLVQTNDGGYALAGSTLSSSGDYDLYLVKTDGFGNMLWNKTYGGTLDDVSWSVVETNDGGYALAGWTYSFGAGSQDAWLVKTDGAGNIQWNRTYGGTNYDGAYSLVQTNDGGYALAGYTYSLGAGSSDVWLIKTDSSGNMQWGKTYGGASYDEAYSVVQTSNGGYAIAGYTDSFGMGDDDIWLIKTDDFGNMLWSKTYGGIKGDGARYVIQTSDGGYALAGYTYSLGAGDTDMWLVKTDQSGDITWRGLSIYVVFWGLNTLTLYRGNTNTDWNYIRIRISIIK
jgi:hypothetical protein